MRIALVSDCYAPRVGGIETQVRSLGQALASAGHDVTVITATPAGDDRGDYFERDGDVTVRRLTMHMPLDLPINPLAGSVLRTDLPGFDIVHIHAGIVSPFAKMAIDACVRTRVPAIVTWHSHLVDATWWYGLANPMRKWVDAGITLTAVSKAAASQVEKAARGKLSVSVLPNLINDEPWESARLRSLSIFEDAADTNPTTPRPLRAVNATRLAGRKRVVALTKLVGKAKNAGADLSLDIYGAGPQESRIRDLAQEGYPVHLMGKVDAQTLADAYVDADVFVSPVVKEAFGIAALEARAAGLPVIYRKGSGVEEFITDGVDGIQVDSDAEMASALSQLYDKPEWLRDLRSGALENRTEYTWERGLHYFTDLYEKVAKQ